MGLTDSPSHTPIRPHKNLLLGSGGNKDLNASASRWVPLPWDVLGSVFPLSILVPFVEQPTSSSPVPQKCGRAKGDIEGGLRGRVDVEAEGEAHGNCGKRCTGLTGGNAHEPATCTYSEMHLRDSTPHNFSHESCIMHRIGTHCDPSARPEAGGGK